MARPQDVLRRLGDPTRLRVLTSLLGGRKNVSQIVSELGLSQPQVSYHLRMLREARLATEERDGRWIWYEANWSSGDGHVRELLTLLAGWSGGRGRAGAGEKGPGRGPAGVQRTGARPRTWTTSCSEGARDEARRHDWKEVREYLKAASALIVPVGTCEQHGPHLPLGCDTLIAEEFADRISEATASGGPTLAYGVNLPCDLFMSGTAGFSFDGLRLCSAIFSRTGGDRGSGGSSS